MRNLRILCAPLVALGLFALFGQSCSGKCVPGDKSTYPACRVDDNYAHSPQCPSGQYCARFVPGVLSDTRCLSACPTGQGCGPNEFCQPVGVGPACGHVTDTDAGIVDAGSCQTIFTCQPNICP